MNTSLVREQCAAVAKGSVHIASTSRLCSCFFLDDYSDRGYTKLYLVNEDFDIQAC